MAKCLISAADGDLRNKSDAKAKLRRKSSRRRQLNLADHRQRKNNFSGTSEMTGKGVGTSGSRRLMEEVNWPQPDPDIINYRDKNKPEVQKQEEKEDAGEWERKMAPAGLFWGAVSGKTFTWIWFIASFGFLQVCHIFFFIFQSAQSVGGLRLVAAFPKPFGTILIVGH